ncbi:MAG: radical SAM protein [Candidatus Brocadiaceae bacterium]|jgi:MoaA/NifB/PqqE/SkfB family radical SAM enzyme
MRPWEAAARLPRFLVRGELSFCFDDLPMRARDLDVRAKANLLLCGLDMLLLSSRAFGLPPAIQIEPTNLCNLRCPLCPTGAGQMQRGKGCMSMATFRRILEELEGALLVAILYGWGEPFLHDGLPEMIEECSARGILTVTSTNGHFIQTMDEALRLVDAGLTGLIVAMDGSTQAAYETYRRSGDLDRVKRCVAMVEQAKALRRSPHPYTNLRVVVTRDNEHELPRIQQFARDSGVNMFSTKSLGCLSHNGEFRGYEASDPGQRRYEYDGSGRRRRSPVRCPFPFRQPTVFWDGTVVGCEFDYNLEAAWGRIGEQDFKSIWNGAAARRLRRDMRRGGPRRAFCGLCPYQDRVSRDEVLWSVELRPAAERPTGGRGG